MSNTMNPARPKFAMREIAVLGGQANGQLDQRVLAVSSVRGLRLNVMSVRKFNALQAVAIRQGYSFSSTGDYRTLAEQITLLKSRADIGYIAGRAWYRYWNGTWWSAKPGAAGAGTPGTSNHGKARSRDFAEMINGRLVSLTLRGKLWLAANAPKYDVYFEVPSEDWHGTDYGGDVIARAVLEEEAGNNGSPIPIFDPANGFFSLYPFDPNKVSLWLTTPPFDSDLVAYAQGVLKKAGHSITVDGEFGPITHQRVVEYQTARGLVIDGKIGPETWAAIDATANLVGSAPVWSPHTGQFGVWPTKTDKPEIKRTKSGDPVLYAQGVLKFKASQPLLVDGLFGEKTEASVRWFQNARGLYVDGIIGKNTWREIDKVAKP